MSLFRSLARAAARALAALAAVTLVAAMESGRLVWRAVRAFFVPADADAADEQAAEVAALQEARQDEPQRMSKAEVRRYAEAFGLAAIQYLAGDDAEHARGRDGLDRNALAYLDSLTLDQAKALVRHDPIHIAAHLLRERHLAGLPRVPSLAEQAAAMQAEYAAKAAALRQMNMEKRIS